MSKVSLIIPTYNRPDYLKRSLDYYNLSKVDFQILIADSSSDENKKKNKEVISSVPNLNIVHLNNYPETINPWHKFANAIEYINSKYCLFCSDDDFVIPRGIALSVAFLESHSDFTVAHGRYIVFYLKKKEIRWMPGYSLESITFPNAESRLKEHLANYTLSTFCGVHRTDFLKMIFKETVKFTNDNRFGELLSSMLALIYGKMRSLDALYAVQEINTNSTAVTTKTIPDFIKEGSYNEQYSGFKNCLVVHLSKNSQLGIEKSRKLIDEAMAEYLEKNYPQNVTNFLKEIMKNIVSLLPEGIYEKIRAAYVGLTFVRGKETFLNLINNSDFIEMRDYLTSYLKI